MFGLLLGLLLCSSWAAFLWRYYLRYRQYLVHRANEKRPQEVEDLITVEDYAKARDYNLDRHKYFFAYELFNQIWTTVLFTSGWLPWLWEVSSALPLQSITFLILKLVLDSSIELPWEMYSNLVVEQKHGFNKQTLGFFLKDRLKQFILLLICLIVLFAFTEWITNNGGPNFFIHIWLVVSGLAFVFLHIFPEYIAPWFDKFVPLPDGELKAALEKQAASLNFPLTKLLVVIGSKRSAHSNAYLYGFWNNKRIVLFDTLLCSEEKQKVLKVCGEAAQEVDTSEKARGLTNDEVLAVLGHELGHWYLWHFWILLSLLDLNLLVMLMAFAKFYKWAPLYEVFGFSGTPTIIGIILVYTFVLGPYFELAKTLMNTAVRRCEYAADGFSANLGYGDQLVGGLKKLGKDNLYLPVDDPLYSMCNHDHPTVAERIEAIKKRQ
ncbi:hypothetical protein Y032_0060g3123 [Ancylostoma ceylanicum]|uniref:CAAX prenyl protease n=1 Tax=Ancylostoma ceylanicum TaxID=53326 RepID=A0A016U2B8_9BILA|nr:hypothetical protein Y032_0060g3123 [Ancylostoma ceylanicum]